MLVNVADPGGELFHFPLVASSTVVSFSLRIPLDASLCGITIATQGVSLGTAGLQLHNAVDLVLGSP